MPIAPPFRHLIGHMQVRDHGPVTGPPADPNAVPSVPRRKNAAGKTSRRPHSDATVAVVRRLVEQTALNYDAISARTGVGRASISRWARDMNWTRPLDAPRATDRMPRYRLSQKLKLRQLAERLRRLAERHIDELEKAPQVDPDKLIAALEVLKMTRLHIQGRRRHAARRDVWGKVMTGQQAMDEREALRRALRELHKGGVNVDKAPDEAIDRSLCRRPHAAGRQPGLPRARQAEED